MMIGYKKCLLSVICLGTLGNAQPQYKSVSAVYTLQHTVPQRPEIVAPKWDIKIHNEELVTPGYIFIAPYASSTIGNNVQTAPYIYDVYGELVWR
jgi:hypothetical protein